MYCTTSVTSRVRVGLWKNAVCTMQAPVTLHAGSKKVCLSLERESMAYLAVRGNANLLCQGHMLQLIAPGQVCCAVVQGLGAKDAQQRQWQVDGPRPLPAYVRAHSQIFHFLNQQDLRLQHSTQNGGSLRFRLLCSA